MQNNADPTLRYSVTEVAKGKLVRGENNGPLLFETMSDAKAFAATLNTMALDRRFVAQPVDAAGVMLTAEHIHRVMRATPYSDAIAAIPLILGQKPKSDEDYLRFTEQTGVRRLRRR